MNRNPIGCAFGIFRLACIILLAVHLGWSPWLLVLAGAVVVVTIDVS